MLYASLSRTLELIGHAALRTYIGQAGSVAIDVERWTVIHQVTLSVGAATCAANGDETK